jgi:predicted nucleic acid-binding protein
LIVVDCSALFDALIQTPRSAAIVERIFADEESLFAPHLIDVEITHVLRRYVLKRQLSVADGARALEDLDDIPIRRYPHGILIPRIWELRDNLTAYDAAYVALAEMIDAPLLTRDAALASTSGHRAQIELV